ncbi:MAG: hypothetical protein KQH63_12190 [Desulfobulbaceae bacterium]|nr:hypothetical protein [Desulfobulbaceae bacterium]
MKIDDLAKSSEADHPPTQYQQVTYVSAAVEGFFTKPSKLDIYNSCVYFFLLLVGCEKDRVYEGIL